MKGFRLMLPLVVVLSVMSYGISTESNAAPLEDNQKIVDALNVLFTSGYSGKRTAVFESYGVFVERTKQLEKAIELSDDDEEKLELSDEIDSFSVEFIAVKDKVEPHLSFLSTVIYKYYKDGSALKRIEKQYSLAHKTWVSRKSKLEKERTSAAGNTGLVLIINDELDELDFSFKLEYLAFILQLEVQKPVKPLAELTQLGLVERDLRLIGTANKIQSQFLTKELSGLLGNHSVELAKLGHDATVIELVGFMNKRLNGDKFDLFGEKVGLTDLNEKIVANYLVYEKADDFVNVTLTSLIGNPQFKISSKLKSDITSLFSRYKRKMEDVYVMPAFEKASEKIHQYISSNKEKSFVEFSVWLSSLYSWVAKSER